MDLFAVNNFGDTRSGGLAGPMGLFVIVLLCIATVLLIRNMNKRLRRLPDSFPDAKPTEREAEIAQLNEDLARSEGEAVNRNVDRGRSATAAGGTEDEVTAITTEREQTRPDGDSGRV